MQFRLNMTVEVDQVGNGLAIHTPIAIQVLSNKGRWQGQCEPLAVSTDEFGSLEEAIVACSQQVATEVQLAVVERPLVLAKITPADVPVNIFQ